MEVVLDKLMVDEGTIAIFVMNSNVGFWIVEKWPLKPACIVEPTTNDFGI